MSENFRCVQLSFLFVGLLLLVTAFTLTLITNICPIACFRFVVTTSDRDVQPMDYMLKLWSCNLSHRTDNFWYGTPAIAAARAFSLLSLLCDVVVAGLSAGMLHYTANERAPWWRYLAGQSLIWRISTAWIACMTLSIVFMAITIACITHFIRSEALTELDAPEDTKQHYSVGFQTLIAAAVAAAVGIIVEAVRRRLPVPSEAPPAVHQQQLRPNPLDKSVELGNLESSRYAR